MKKANFTLRISGSDIIILCNGKPLKKTSNYKKALRIIALHINQKNIENFQLYVYERNKLFPIKDFDPEVIINHSAGKINRKREDDFDLDDDEDDLKHKLFGGNPFEDSDDFDLDRKLGPDFDHDDRRSNMFSQFRENRSFRSPSWTYIPSNNDEDVEKIKNNMKNILR